MEKTLIKNQKSSPKANFTSAVPIVQVIESPRGWININWAEIWRYRELFGFLVWRDIEVKYKQTLLGFAWAILVPFLHMVVFSVVFGKFAKLPSDGLPANQPITFHVFRQAIQMQE